MFAQYGFDELLNPSVAEKIKTWRYDWEKPYVEGMEDLVFRNTFRDIKQTLRTLGDEYGTRFEFECYDVGHLYNLAYFVDAGLVKAAPVSSDGVRHSWRAWSRS